MAIIVSHRNFLKAGLIGTLALTVVGGLYPATQRAVVPAKFILDDAAKSVLAAIIPVVLKDAIEPVSVHTSTAIGRIQEAINALLYESNCTYGIRPCDG